MVMIKKISVALLLMSSFCQSWAQDKNAKPKLYGYALAQFKIDTIISQDNLDDRQTFQKNWIVQQSQADSAIKRYVQIQSGKLEVQDPRGCTIWFKNKFKGPVMISYYVTAPSRFNESNNIVPRDINQFWMANTADGIDVDGNGGLFDYGKYNGDFKSYDDIKGYYASTGGGNAKNYNRTTRMRRYPRSVDGNLVDHPGLNTRDNDSSFLIVPDKEYLIQLIAANDIVQYIFDGKIVYEIKNGDEVDLVNDADKNAVNKNVSKAIWGDAKWKWYNEGYFGFRMTRTHHTYRDFKVYRLIKK
jgi:hypothetical protein